MWRRQHESWRCCLRVFGPAASTCLFCPGCARCTGLQVKDKRMKASHFSLWFIFLIAVQQFPLPPSWKETASLTSLASDLQTFSKCSAITSVANLCVKVFAGCFKSFTGWRDDAYQSSLITLSMAASIVRLHSRGFLQFYLWDEVKSSCKSILWILRASLNYQVGEDN